MRFLLVGWMLFLLLLSGCGGGGSEGDVFGGDDAPVSDVSPADGVVPGDVSEDIAVVPDVGDPLPQPILTVLETETGSPRPAHLVFASLLGKGLGESVAIEGIMTDVDLWWDGDDAGDNEFPFSVVLRDEAGTEIFRRTMREPLQIREFLINAGAGVTELGLEGFVDDLLIIFPELANFAVLVAVDENAVSIAFERRELDETVTVLFEGPLNEVPEMPEHPLVDAEVTQLIGSTPPEEAIDVVILADGYTEEEMGLFATQAGMVTAQFANIDPYATYKNRFNFYRIDTVSNESGAGWDCSKTQDVPNCKDGFRDTAFRTSYLLRLAVLAGVDVSDRALFQMDQWGVYQVGAKVPFDRIMVLVNSPKYGAFGLVHATLNAQQAHMSVVAVHEFGHAFGLLGDEYVVEGDICQIYDLTPDYPNISALVEEAKDAKWSAWLTPGVPLPTPDDDEGTWDESVGFFLGAGGGCTELYRPKNDCLMRSTHGQHPPLCPICSEQTIKRIYAHVDLLRPTPVKVVGGTLVAQAWEDTKIQGEWSVDGEPAGDAKNPLALQAPEEGSKEVTVTLTVRQNTTKVRTNPEILNETVILKVRVEPPVESPE